MQNRKRRKPLFILYNRKVILSYCIKATIAMPFEIFLIALRKLKSGKEQIKEKIKDFFLFVHTEVKDCILTIIKDFWVFLICYCLYKNIDKNCLQNSNICVKILI